MPRKIQIANNLNDRVDDYTRVAILLAEHGAELGFTPAEVSEYESDLAELRTKITEAAFVKAQCRAYLQSRNAKDAAVQAKTRSIVRRAQANPATTNQMRVKGGLTLPGQGGLGTFKPETATAPLIHVTTPARGHVRVAWGPRPMNRRGNAKPDGVRGAEIQRAVIADPKAPKAWTHLASVTASPYLDRIESSETMTVAYRVRYFGSKGATSAWSDHEAVAVTPV